MKTLNLLINTGMIAALASHSAFAAGTSKKYSGIQVELARCAPLENAAQPDAQPEYPTNAYETVTLYIPIEAFNNEAKLTAGVPATMAQQLSNPSTQPGVLATGTLTMKRLPAPNPEADDRSQFLFVSPFGNSKLDITSYGEENGLAKYRKVYNRGAGPLNFICKGFFKIQN